VQRDKITIKPLTFLCPLFAFSTDHRTPRGFGGVVPSFRRQRACERTGSRRPGDRASRPHSARGRGDGFRGGRHGARLARGGPGPEYLKSRAPARNIA